MGSLGELVMGSRLIASDRSLTSSAFIGTTLKGGSFSPSDDWMLCCFQLIWPPVPASVPDEL